MIKKATHVTQACPVCGRPLHIRTDYLGHLVTCQHCRGRFIASCPASSDCGKTNQNGSLLDRADRLLATCAHRLGIHHCWPNVWQREGANRRVSSVCTAEPVDGSNFTDLRENTSHLCEATEDRGMPTVLLLEHRDDVHSLLSAQFAAGGIQTIQATNSARAIRQYVSRPTDVLIVNGDQPDESAWLLAAKLHLTHPTARIWVYKRRMSGCDVATAAFLQIEETIDYDGSTCRLAKEVLDRLATLLEHLRDCDLDLHGCR